MRNKLLGIYCFLLCSVTLYGQNNNNLSLLYHWADTTIVADVYYGSKFNEIWGLAHNNREYAIMGATIGTYVFDVTDPANAGQIDFLPGSGQPNANLVVHRDYHDYQGYLYEVSDEDQIGLRIYDMQFLPDSLHLVYSSDTSFQLSHNIFIDSAAARLYVCSAKKSTGGANALEVYSLANPVNPVLEFTINSFGHAHDVYARNDTVFVNAGTSDGLWVLDMTGATPQLISSLFTYPDRGYNHSGWWSEDGTVYAFADENYGMRVKVCDASDLSNIQVIDTIGSGVDPNSIAHNLMIKDNLLYVSYYHDGLQIFDISNPSNVQKVAWFDTYTPNDHDSYRGNWGVYCFLPSGRILASDMQYGLFVFALDSGVSTTKEPNFGLSSINAFPNPLITEQLQVEMILEEEASYRMDLYSFDGRWIKTLLPFQVLSSGKQVVHLNIPAQLAAGPYQVIITNKKGQKHSIPLVKHE